MAFLLSDCTAALTAGKVFRFSVFSGRRRKKQGGILINARKDLSKQTMIRY